MPFITRLIARVREWLGGYCSLEGGVCCGDRGNVCRWDSHDGLIIKETIMEGLAFMGFIFGILGLVAFVRVHQLEKKLKEKGISDSDDK